MSIVVEDTLGSEGKLIGLVIMWGYESYYKKLSSRASYSNTTDRNIFDRNIVPSGSRGRGWVKFEPTIMTAAKRISYKERSWGVGAGI